MKILIRISKFLSSVFNKLKKKKLDPIKHDKNILIASEIGFVIITRMAQDRTFRRQFELKFPKETKLIDTLARQIEE